MANMEQRHPYPGGYGVPGQTTHSAATLPNNVGLRQSFGAYAAYSGEVPCSRFGNYATLPPNFSGEQVTNVTRTCTCITDL